MSDSRIGLEQLKNISRGIVPDSETLIERSQHWESIFSKYAIEQTDEDAVDWDEYELLESELENDEDEAEVEEVEEEWWNEPEEEAMELVKLEDKVTYHFAPELLSQLKKVVKREMANLGKLNLPLWNYERHATSETESIISTPSFSLSSRNKSSCHEKFSSTMSLPNAMMLGTSFVNKVNVNGNAQSHNDFSSTLANLLSTGSSFSVTVREREYDITVNNDGGNASDLRKVQSVPALAKPKPITSVSEMKRLAAEISARSSRNLPQEIFLKPDEKSLVKKAKKPEKGAIVAAKFNNHKPKYNRIASSSESSDTTSDSSSSSCDQPKAIKAPEPTFKKPKAIKAPEPKTVQAPELSFKKPEARPKTRKARRLSSEPKARDEQIIETRTLVQPLKDNRPRPEAKKAVEVDIKNSEVPSKKPEASFKKPETPSKKPETQPEIIQAPWWSGYPEVRIKPTKDNQTRPEAKKAPKLWIQKPEVPVKPTKDIRIPAQPTNENRARQETKKAVEADIKKPEVRPEAIKVPKPKFKLVEAPSKKPEDKKAPKSEFKKPEASKALQSQFNKPEDKKAPKSESKKPEARAKDTLNRAVVQPNNEDEPAELRKDNRVPVQPRKDNRAPLQSITMDQTVKSMKSVIVSDSDDSDDEFYKSYRPVPPPETKLETKPSPKRTSSKSSDKSSSDSDDDFWRPRVKKSKKKQS